MVGRIFMDLDGKEMLVADEFYGINGVFLSLIFLESPEIIRVIKKDRMNFKEISPRSPHQDQTSWIVGPV